MLPPLIEVWLELVDGGLQRSDPHSLGRQDRGLLLLRAQDQEVLAAGDQADAVGAGQVVREQVDAGELGDDLTTDTDSGVVR